MRHFRLPKFFTDIDYYMAFISIALIAAGIASIASAGVDAEGNRFSNEFLKQTIWAATGVLLSLIAMSLDISRLKDYTAVAYILVMLVLVYTLAGGKVVNGARAWIGLGEYGIQPSEFAKLATILFLARYLDASDHDSDFVRLVKASLIAGVPILLILAQPDFGSALAFFPILIFMLYAAKLNKRFIVFIILTILTTFVFLILPLSGKFFFQQGNFVAVLLSKKGFLAIAISFMALVLALSAAGWLKYKKAAYFWICYLFSILDISAFLAFAAGKVLKEYQIMRLMVFLNPQVDPQGAGWNIIQSVTAVGSGGLAGRGYLQGTQSHARFIPQQSTDFIFSIIAEEWGFIGSLVLIGLYAAFFFRIIGLMDTTKDRYSSLVCSGIFGLFFFHFMINVGMAIGIMPITGIPLYFISYGGSSLWAAMMAVGFMLGISARRYRM